MPFHLHSIETLDDAVGPLADLLASCAAEDDLFTRELVIAPSVGVQQWLREQLARRLGVSEGRGDGVVANVDFGFPGRLINRTLPDKSDGDPWALEALTFHVLDVLAAHGPTLGVPQPRLIDGPLPAARRIADLFDRYHFHRGPMMLSWAQGQAVRMAARPGQRPPPLPDRYRWQFELWSRVRESIDTPSTPEQMASTLARVRAGERPAGLPSRIAIVGVSTLPALVLDFASALSDVIDVHLWASHPSPMLRARLAADPVPASPDPANPIPADLGRANLLARSVPIRTGSSVWSPRVALGADPSRGLAHVPSLESWTRPSQAMEVLLTAAGLRGAASTRLPDAQSPDAQPETTLLARLQGMLRADNATAYLRPRPGTKAAPPPNDLSLEVHRTHGPQRQAEVLREVLLHTFKELPDLDPADVLIVAPDISTMAPHLRAVFGELHARHEGDLLHLPVVVGDRSLRETNPVADVLARLLDVPSSRFGVADLRELASLEVVQRRLGVDAGTVESWFEWAEHVHVRWGLTPAQRTHFGLPQDFEAHTWLHGVQRLVYGACLPDGDPALELGGVAPAAGLATGDLADLGALAQLLQALTDFVDSASRSHTVSAWCDLFERTLEALVRVERSQDPARARVTDLLTRIREHSAHSAVEVALSEMQSLMGRYLSGDPGWLDPRSGRITAASMVPLRGVPYRVICIAGLDEGAIPRDPSDGDDLLRLQPFVGDPDVRGEQRQAVLEFLLAAQDRVIVTTTGFDARSNAEVPPATVLADLLDLVTTLEGTAEHIKVDHPRHAADVRYHRTSDGVYQQMAHPAPASRAVFGHVAAHRRGAELMAGAEPDLSSSARNVSEVDPQAIAPTDVIELDDLVTFWSNPADLYVKQSLKIDAWQGFADPEACIDLEVRGGQFTRISADLLHISRHLGEAADDELEAHLLQRIPAWRERMQAEGGIPPGAAGDDLLAQAEDLIYDLLRQSRAKQVSLLPGRALEVRVPLPDGRRIEGSIAGWHDDAGDDEFDLVRVATDREFIETHYRLKLSTWLASLQTGRYVRGVQMLRDTGRSKWGQCITRAAQLSNEVSLDEARTALMALVTLYDEARLRPFGRFDKTAGQLVSKPESARSTFEYYCRSRLARYHAEAMVFGMKPQFDRIFGPVERDFFERLHRFEAGPITFGVRKASPRTKLDRTRLSQ